MISSGQHAATGATAGQPGLHSTHIALSRAADAMELQRGNRLDPDLVRKSRKMAEQGGSNKVSFSFQF